MNESNLSGSWPVRELYERSLFGIAERVSDQRREGEVKKEQERVRSNEQGLEGSEIEENLGEAASELVGVKVAVGVRGEGEGERQCQSKQKEKERRTVQ